MKDKKEITGTKKITNFALRGAIGFGTGCGIAFGIPAVIGPDLFIIVECTIGFVISGVIGGAYLAKGRNVQRSALIASIGFAIGFIAAGMVIMFTCISLQGGVSISGGATGWGVGFGIAGVIGALFLRSGLKVITFRSLVYLAIAGGVGFGIGGAIGGAIAFAIFTKLNYWAIFIGLLIAHILGGTLLGAALGYIEKANTDMKYQNQTKALLPVERSGIAVTATVLGIFGMIFAVVFPVRFRLPQNFVFMIVLGGKEVAEQVTFFLALLGLPPLTIGVVALAKIKKSQGALFGKAWALIGMTSGVILTLFSLLLFLVSPISRHFEAKYAVALLESVHVHGQEKDWNYGNVIHDANLILGRVALKKGNIEKAKYYLLEAGKTPGSPQLNSFGPSFILARELLEKGGKSTVLEYLDLVSKFWANSENVNPSNHNAVRVAQEHAEELSKWKNEIINGKNPWGKKLH